MISLFKKTALSAALAATVLATATPAMADPYREHRRGGDATGTAIAAGIFGLAIGAIIASSGRHDRDRDDYRARNGGYYRGTVNGGNYYYNDPYRNGGGYYPNGSPRGYDNYRSDNYRSDNNGYRYDREGNRYDNNGQPYGYERRGW